MNLSPHRIYAMNERVIIKVKFYNNLSERLDVMIKKDMRFGQSGNHKHSIIVSYTNPQ